MMAKFPWQRKLGATEGSDKTFAFKDGNKTFAPACASHPHCLIVLSVLQDMRYCPSVENAMLVTSPE